MASKVLFVANANSELRYDSGAIDLIDLSLVEAKIQAWTGPGKDLGGCKPASDHPETLVCDEQQFMKQSASRQPSGVRIGNFSTDLGLQDFTTRPAGSDPLVSYRLFAPTRGDPSIAWADYDGDRLSCTTGTDNFAQCDDAHRLQAQNNDVLSAVIPDEPFEVFADSQNGFAVVTHLTNGAVSLIDSRAGSDAQLADVRYNLFASDPTTGQRGATGVAGHRGPGTDTIVYVGSRTDDRIQTFTIGRPVSSAPPYLVPANYFLLTSVGTNPGVGNSVDTRGVKFSPPHDPSVGAPDRLYIVNRRPPSVQIFDASIGPDGFPRNAATGASDICPQASSLAVLDPGTTGDDERVYITCFQDGTVYVVDPRGTSQAEDIITVGRGPFAIAASPETKQLFVSNFLEDTIAVIDVDPSSATKDRVVLRIGIPRTP